MLVHGGHVAARRFFTSANAGSYGTVVRIATLGRDFAWKREIIKSILGRKSVLELACGTGILSSILTESGKSVTGIDLSFEYLRTARSKVEFGSVQGTAEMLPYRDGSFDAVASSYLAKYVDVNGVIEEGWRVLRPGGRIVFHDFTFPDGIMRGLWITYFDILRLTGRFIASWRTVFNQLDLVIRDSKWVDQTMDALEMKGFRDIACKYYTAGTAAIVSAEKP